MDKWKRRTAYYLTTLVVFLFGYAFLYDYGMRVYEGHSQPFYQSLQVVLETFTTTGYGSDAPWETIEMTLLVMVKQALVLWISGMVGRAPDELWLYFAAPALTLVFWPVIHVLLRDLQGRYRTAA